MITGSKLQQSSAHTLHALVLETSQSPPPARHTLVAILPNHATKVYRRLRKTTLGTPRHDENSALNLELILTKGTIRIGKDALVWGSFGHPSLLRRKSPTRHTMMRGFQETSET